LPFTSPKFAAHADPYAQHSSGALTALDRQLNGISDDNGSAFRRELESDCAPDTETCAGDNRDLVLEQL
jgi:hypothetical protein